MMMNYSDVPFSSSPNAPPPCCSSLLSSSISSFSSSLLSFHCTSFVILLFLPSSLSSRPAIHLTLLLFVSPVFLRPMIILSSSVVLPLFPLSSLCSVDPSFSHLLLFVSRFPFGVNPLLSAYYLSPRDSIPLPCVTPPSSLTLHLINRTDGQKSPFLPCLPLFLSCRCIRSFPYVVFRNVCVYVCGVSVCLCVCG